MFRQGDTIVPYNDVVKQIQSTIESTRLLQVDHCIPHKYYNARGRTCGEVLPVEGVPGTNADNDESS
jgi:hypothetical protein